MLALIWCIRSLLKGASVQAAKELVKRAFPRLVQSRHIRRLTAAEREIKLLPLLCSRDKIAVDIGANLGLYVHYFMHLCKAVVAFEPIPALQVHLKRHYPRVQIEGAALSDVSGSAKLRMPTGNFSWATISPTNALELADSQTGLTVIEVPVRVLDNYQLQNVGVMKIDVEGHEESVLRGGIGLISSSKPHLIIEVEERHNSGSLKRVSDLMHELGYVGLYLDGADLKSIKDFRIERDQSISNVGRAGKTGRYINNFVFVPAEKAGSVCRNWELVGS